MRDHRVHTRNYIFGCLIFKSFLYEYISKSRNSYFGYLYTVSVYTYVCRMTFTTVDDIVCILECKISKVCIEHLWKNFSVNLTWVIQVLYVIFEGQNKVKKTFGIRPWLPENKKEQIFLLLYFSIFYILEMKNLLYKKNLNVIF